MQPQQPVVAAPADSFCCGCSGRAKVITGAAYSIIISAIILILMIISFSGAYFYAWVTVIYFLLHICWLVAGIILIVGVTQNWRSSAHGVIWQVFLWILVCFAGLSFLYAVVVGVIVSSYDATVGGIFYGYVFGVMLIPLALHLTFGILGTVGWSHYRRTTFPPTIQMVHVPPLNTVTMVHQQGAYPGLVVQQYPGPGVQQGYPGPQAPPQYKPQ